MDTRQRWVLFLSYERFRGPLTLTFDPLPTFLRQIQPGWEVAISNGRLCFPSLDVQIRAVEESVWRGAPKRQAILTKSKRREALVDLAQLALNQKGGEGFAWALPALLGLPASSKPSVEANELLLRILSLREALRSGDTPQAITQAEGFLGLGRGLTPSGDDLLLGLLLTLNRWGQVLMPVIDVRLFNERVGEKAYPKTTTLGANLIECAAAGQSDERLETALDAIISGAPLHSEWRSNWLGWGASSGVDVLVGMALALT